MNGSEPIKKTVRTMSLMRLTRSHLPAQALHACRDLVAARDVDEIEHQLTLVRMTLQCFGHLCPVEADDEDVRFLDYGLKLRPQQRADVRQVLHDEPTVGSKELRQVHLRVVDQQVEALAY